MTSGAPKEHGLIPLNWIGDIRIGPEQDIIIA
jgi:hypothetical protein